MGYLSTVPPRSSYWGGGVGERLQALEPPGRLEPRPGGAALAAAPPLLTGLCPAWSKHYIIEDVAMLL